MPENDEPSDAYARVEYYRAILDSSPEYWPLTREAVQFWTPNDAKNRLGISPHLLREAYTAGRLPNAFPGGGSAGLQIPRSSLIIHLGRLVTGWYDRNPAQAG